MLGPELEVPVRGGVQLVVVADAELLPRLDVGRGHHAHDVAEPRVPELSKAAVVVEGVTNLVSQGCPVVLQSLLARQDVQVSLSPAANPVVRPVRLVEILAGQPPLPHAVEESAELTPRNVSLGEESLARPGPRPGLTDEHVATLEGVSEQRRAGDAEGAGWLVVVEAASTDTHINLQLRDDSSQAELPHVTQPAAHQSAVGKLALDGRDEVGVEKELVSPVVDTLSLSVRTGDLPHQKSPSPCRRPADSRLLATVKAPYGFEVFACWGVLYEGSLSDPPPVLDPPHQIAPVQLLPHHALQSTSPPPPAEFLPGLQHQTPLALWAALLHLTTEIVPVLVVDFSFNIQLSLFLPLYTVPTVSY